MVKDDNKWMEKRNSDEIQFNSKVTEGCWIN